MTSQTKIAVLRKVLHGIPYKVWKLQVEKTKKEFFDFISEDTKLWGVPSGACGNAGMPRMCSPRKGFRFRHPDYGSCIIVGD